MILPNRTSIANQKYHSSHVLAQHLACYSWCFNLKTTQSKTKQIKLNQTLTKQVKTYCFNTHIHFFDRILWISDEVRRTLFDFSWNLKLSNRLTHPTLKFEMIPFIPLGRALSLDLLSQQRPCLYFCFFLTESAQGTERT